MKRYQIFIKHVLEPEWINKRAHYFKTLDEASKAARLEAFIYYDSLAEKYNLPVIKDFVEAAEELTGKEYGKDLPCEDVDVLFWSYFHRMMEYKVVEL